MLKSIETITDFDKSHLSSEGVDLNQTTTTSIQKKLDIDAYFRQNQFDGNREAIKEKNLGSFFEQKFQRVNTYLKKREQLGVIKGKR